MNNEKRDAWAANCAAALSQGVLCGAVVSASKSEIEHAVNRLESLSDDPRLVICNCPIGEDLLHEEYFAQAYFTQVLTRIGDCAGVSIRSLPPISSSFLRLKIATKKLFSDTGQRCLLVCSNFDRCVEASDPSAVDDLCGNLVSIADNADEMQMSYLLGTALPVVEVERHKRERSPSSVLSRVRNFTLEDHS